MVLSDLSIRRPVLATVMSLAIILVGIMAFSKLSVREYPNIDAPVVSVRTVYKGASPQVIESQISQPIEDSLSGIEGIRTIKSVSREEVSQITVEFVRERDVEAAANDVRDKVARVRSRLPDETDDPVVSKIEADAQAIIWIAMSSSRYSQLQLSDMADRIAADRLKNLPGVASVMIGGERKYAMRIWLDREKLAAKQVTVQEVETALRQQNVEIPAGRVESQEREFTVLAQTDMSRPEEFERMIITVQSGYPIRLSDLGRAELGPLDERSAMRLNGQPAIGLGVVKQSTANTLEVARAVKAAIPNLKKALPEGIVFDVGYDSSIFIEKSISAVYSTMFEAVVLVVLVVFFFLRSGRATLIPFVTIPVSLVGAFIFLWIMGFSINILTLLGIVLAIGLVVDDAIVVLENVHRHIEEGMTSIQAAFQGSREIAFAVMAMTVTLAAVFAPLAFMSGNTGRLFTEFALTVSAAVVVSGFVALTLTPMMCGRLLKHETNHGKLYQTIERWMEALTAGYRSVLEKALTHQMVILGVFVLTALSAGFLFKTLKSELAPLEDRGFFMGVMSAPEGSSFDYTDRYARQVEKIYQGVPEIKTYFSVVAPGLEKPNPVNSAFSFVQLKPWEERSRKQMEVTASIQPKMFAGMPGVMAFPINPPSLGQSSRSQPLQFVIQGESYDQLQLEVNRLMGALRPYPGLLNLDTDLKLSKPQLAVDVDRDRSADAGVTIDAIGRTMESLLGGRQVTRFKRDGKQYDVMVQMERDARRQPMDVEALYVKGSQGNMVPLSGLVEVRETVSPKELNHFNRIRAAVITAGVAPGYTLGQVLNYVEETASKTLSSGMNTAVDGQSRELKESGAALYLTFVLALLFIYLVLSAQFESFISPFVIMLTVPLAMTGALLALNLSGGTLNVYSQIGLVMLVGLITKHGILIVEFANQRRETLGENALTAVIEAATLRLRPILMTTAAMVLGALPLALAHGAGAESRQPIGWVIVGGLSLGTLLTLFVVPVAYTFIVRSMPVKHDF